MKVCRIKPLVFKAHPIEKMEWIAPIEPFRWQAVAWKYKASDRWWLWWVGPNVGDAGGIRGKCRTRKAAQAKASREYERRVAQLLDPPPMADERVEAAAKWKAVAMYDGPLHDPKYWAVVDQDGRKLFDTLNADSRWTIDEQEAMAKQCVAVLTTADSASGESATIAELRAEVERLKGLLAATIQTGGRIEGELARLEAELTQLREDRRVLVNEVKWGRVRRSADQCEDNEEDYANICKRLREAEEATDASGVLGRVQG